MAARKKSPKVLRPDPIIQATFGIRFKSDASGVADLLPGLLYSHLKDRYDGVESLPSMEIPKVVRDRLPNAAYQATKRLVGKGTHLGIAERAITVEIVKPYWGWEEYSPLIFQVIAAVSKTDIVSEIERVSIRYQNILTEKENPHGFDGLELQIAIADYKVGDAGFQLRAEVESGGCMSIIQVSKSAEASYMVKGERVTTTGLLLDIDTIKYGPFPKFQNEFESIVNGVHDVEKEVFFSLLKDDTINQMNPLWE